LQIAGTSRIPNSAVGIMVVHDSRIPLVCD